jgi:hypothetical protein
MPLTPEHKLQIDVVKLAHEVIEAPHRLRAFDRTKNFSSRQHLHEAARGIRAGTPDCELVFEGRSINVELKAGDNDISDNQEREMDMLRRAGAYCGVAWSCVEVVEHWRAAGVPMVPSADIIALDRDLKREGRALKAKAAAPPPEDETTREGVTT